MNSIDQRSELKLHGRKSEKKIRSSTKTGKGTQKEKMKNKRGKIEKSSNNQHIKSS